MLQRGNEPMKLTGRDEGIDRIGENDQLCAADGLQRLGEVFLQGVDFRANGNVLEVVRRVALLKIT